MSAVRTCQREKCSWTYISRFLTLLFGNSECAAFGISRSFVRVFAYRALNSRRANQHWNRHASPCCERGEDPQWS